jgi:hypothetical protein
LTLERRIPLQDMDKVVKVVSGKEAEKENKLAVQAKVISM